MSAIKTLIDLPEELLINVFRFLEFQDAAALGDTCQITRKIFQNIQEFIQGLLLKKDFPGIRNCIQVQPDQHQRLKALAEVDVVIRKAKIIKETLDQPFQGHIGSVNRGSIHSMMIKGCTSLSTTQNGSFLISGSQTGCLNIWDLKYNTLCHSSLFHEAPILMARVMPGDTDFISVSLEGKIARWNIQTGECLYSYKPPVSGTYFNCVEMTEDSSKIIAGCHWDLTVSIWDLTTLPPFPVVLESNSFMEGIASCLKTNTTANSLLTGYHNSLIKLWNLGTGQILKSFRQPGGDIITALEFMPRTNQIISTTQMGSRICIWNCESGESVAKIKNARANPSGRYNTLKMINNYTQLLAETSAGEIEIWDPETLTCRFYNSKPSWASDKSFCSKILEKVRPDILLTGSFEKQLRIFNLSTNKAHEMDLPWTVSTFLMDPSHTIVYVGYTNGKIDSYEILPKPREDGPPQAAALSNT